MFQGQLIEDNQISNGIFIAPQLIKQLTSNMAVSPFQQYSSYMSA